MLQFRFTSQSETGEMEAAEAAEGWRKWRSRHLSFATIRRRR